MEALIELTKRTVEIELGRSTRPHARFRNRFHHTLRVLKWAERIQAVERGDLSIVSLAVLLHDVGWDVEIPHQNVSFQFATDFLSRHAIEEDMAARVCNAVLLHNQRHILREELTIEDCIVMDADALDESGILTVVWDSLAAAAEDGNNGYGAVFDRITAKRGQSNPKTRNFKTDTGARLFEERTQVLDSALRELQFELES